jgi:hypothetical protein
MQKLKNTFATHGTPRRIESDGGPPFNSKEFSTFADEEGFYHHRVTPDHARANGEAESFMKMVNKTEQIARLQGKDIYYITIYYILGDYVLVIQTKRNKWTTAYEPAFYIIYRIEGSTISARRITDGRETCRDTSHFKLANSVVQNLEDENLDRPCDSTEEED